MNKKLYFTFLLTFIFIKAFPQQDYFSKIFSADYGENCFNILPYQNGYLVLDAVSNQAGLISMSFLVLDSAGNILSKKPYHINSSRGSFMGSPGGFFLYNDSTLITAGSLNLSDNDAALYKFNVRGDVVSRQTYGDTTYNAGWQAKRTRDGGIAMVIQTYQYSAIGEVALMKTDSAGNLLWIQRYSTPRNDLATSLDTTIEGGFVMAGNNLSYSVPMVSLCSDMYCFKTDSLGNLQWRKFFGYQYADGAWSVTQCHDSTIVLGGYYSTFDLFPNVTCTDAISQPWIIKLDMQGNTIWEHKFGESKYGTTIQKVRELSDGSLIAAGTVGSDSTDTPLGLIIKASANGDSLWYRTYAYYPGAYSDNILEDIRPTRDGGFIASGWVNPHLPDTGHGQDSWILKIDSNGCEISNCLVSSVFNSIKSESGISFYPVPSDGLFYITDESKNKTREWTVFDMTGKNVLKGKNLPDEIDLRMFSDGIYMYRIVLENNSVISGKLIKNN